MTSYFIRKYVFEKAFVDFMYVPVIWRPGIAIFEQLTESVESSFLIHQGGYHDLFVCPC